MNLKQHVFVTEYLRSADHIMAYKNAYQSSSDFKTIESATNRLLKNPEVANAIQSVQDTIRAEVEQELKQELKTELLSIQKKRELLAQIAMGEQVVEQNYRGKNCSQCTQFVKPTINQMLKAIDLDNKLAGHYGNKATGLYKPTRIEQKQPPAQQNTTNKTNDITINEPQANTIPIPQDCFVPRNDEKEGNHNKTQQLKPQHEVKDKQSIQIAMVT